MDNVSKEIKNFGVQSNGGQQCVTVIEKFSGELVGANARQKGDGEGISVDNQKEVQVIDLTTGNNQQEIAVGPVKSKFPTVIPATTVFAQMFEATADTLKDSADGHDRQSDIDTSVGYARGGFESSKHWL